MLFDWSISAFLFFLLLTSTLTGSKFYASTIHNWFVKLSCVLLNWFSYPEFELFELFKFYSFDYYEPELLSVFFDKNLFIINFQRINPNIAIPAIIKMIHSSILSYHKVPAGLASWFDHNRQLDWPEHNEHPSEHG